MVKKLKKKKAGVLPGRKYTYRPAGHRPFKIFKMRI